MTHHEGTIVWEVSTLDEAYRDFGSKIVREKLGQCEEEKRSKGKGVASGFCTLPCFFL